MLIGVGDGMIIDITKNKARIRIELMKVEIERHDFEDSQFEKWNCGFVNGVLIVRG